MRIILFSFLIDLFFVFWKVANKLEVFPGSEFRVAYEEAMKYGGRVILGDRPVQVHILPYLSYNFHIQISTLLCRHNFCVEYLAWFIRRYSWIFSISNHISFSLIKKGNKRSNTHVGFIRYQLSTLHEVSIFMVLFNLQSQWRARTESRLDVRKIRLFN